MRGSTVFRQGLFSFPTTFNGLVKSARNHGVVIEKAALEDLWVKIRQHDYLSSRPRWLADCKARVGKCIMFGIPLQDPEYPSQETTHSLAPQTLLKFLAIQLGPTWKASIGGHEGFRTQYPHMSRMRVNWGDLDSMGHVNNVTHIRWAETARMHWARRFALNPSDREHNKQWNELWTPKGQGLILKSIKMDYKLPLTYPDLVSVVHRLRSPPSPTDTSFMLDVMIFSNRHQRIAARGEEEIVMYDYTKMRKTPIPPFMTDAFAKTWADQECQKLDATINAFNIELRIILLEKMTWDREGAVEDLGASNSGA